MQQVRYGLLIALSAVIVLMVVVTGYLLWQLGSSPPDNEPVLAQATPEPVLATAEPTPLPSPTMVPTFTAVATAQPPAEPTAAPTEAPTPVIVTVTPDPSQPPPEPEIAATDAITTAESLTAVSNATVIGTSREGRPIESYRFGSGPNPLVFVGGIHGGYEWNTIVLAYEAIDYFTANPTAVPESISLYIIPSANPDGQHRVTNKEGRFTGADIVTGDTFPGRFNSIDVDLNRNWDCLWSEEAYWRDQLINPGSSAFSEPESQALRDYLVGIGPRAVVFWHSAANGVFAASCPELFQPSMVLAQLYGAEAGYPVYEAFTAYQITGDAGDWLATIGIPSITVELRNRQDTDWEQNLRGMQAVLRFYNTGPVEPAGE